MKRHLIFCIAFVAVMTSCVKEPQIYRRLTKEEAAAIPYQIGESIRMLDQNDDTICLTVVHDTNYVAINYNDYNYYPTSKMSIEPHPYYYMREVVFQSPPEDSCLLRCCVAPEKVITISYEKQRLGNGYYEDYFYYWQNILDRTLSLNNLPTTSFSVGETTYDNVYFEEGSYMTDFNTISYAWYYSEQFGLLAAKDGEHSLTLLP